MQNYGAAASPPGQAQGTLLGIQKEKGKKEQRSCPFFPLRGRAI